MGCNTSNTEHSGEDEEHTGDDGFTENQIDSIKSTWPLLKTNGKSTGTDLFRNIFLLEPKIKLLFNRNKKLDDEDLLISGDFLDHVDRFINTIDHVVDTLDSSREETEQTLLLLGAKHATVTGFKDEYFTVYAKCIIDTFETVIGEEFIIEVKESWEVFCAFMIRYMREGFKLYRQDHGLESIQEENLK